MSHKTAIITGASSGIGAGLARVLVKNGYHVGLIARRKIMLKDLQKELGKDKVKILPLDITKPTAETQFENFLNQFDKVDIVVLNAGVGIENKYLESESELATVDVNVRAFTSFAAASFRYFKKKKCGHIVGVSSILALCHSANTPAYSASKAYISNYLKGLRGRAYNENLDITITDIKPGFIDTPMAQKNNTFWLAPVDKAAQQIFNKIKSKATHVYITKRWRMVAWLFKLLPERIFNKIISKIF